MYNHEVDLYYVDEKRSIAEEKYYNRAFFYKFIPKQWHGNNWKIRFFKDTIELFYLYKLHKKIASAIRKKNYDLLFVNASKFIESPFILQFPNTKKIFYLHDPHDRSLYESNLMQKQQLDIFRKCYEKIIHFFRVIQDKQNLQGADYFLANSKFTQKMFRKTYGKKSTVAYLGVDTAFFTHKLVSKEFDILYIGSHEPVDGYSLLENALKQIKKKLSVRTVFFEKEWLSKEQLRNLYRKSKVIVCLARNEPFGLVPLEAMSCGVPVIAISEGGYKETVIDGETGYLIKNIKELADKISYLRHEERRVMFGKKAQQEVLTNWTWKKRITELEKKLLKIINP